MSFFHTFSKKYKNLDDPKTTEEYHGYLIRKKLFLKNIYIDFYKQFKKSIQSYSPKELYVEIGSGAGFVKEIIPYVITSDILRIKNVDIHFSALKMPFKDKSVRAFFMIDVLHHIPNAEKFLKEVDRCLKPGGKVVCIEPAATTWSRFIYRHFHHETFDDKAPWKFRSKGPLSSSNLALPWIIFYRDRPKFEHLFPNLRVKIKPHTPLRYLLSGGLSLPQLLPSFTYAFITKFEKKIEKFNQYIGMFYTIELTKVIRC